MTTIDALDDPQALQQLVFQLSHVNAGIKIAALRQAVAFQDKAPLKPILNALLDKREDVHGTATETVGALKPWITDEQWLETLQRPLLIIYQVALAILETQGQDAPFKPILRTACSLKRPLRAQAQRLLAMQAQHWSAKKVAWFTEATTKSLQEGAPTNRIIALELLGVLGDKAPLELLLQSLQDDNADVRWTALEQLTAYGRQGRELPIEPIAALINDPSPRVRTMVLYTLNTQDKIPISLFITAIQDANEGVRQTAAFYLGKYKDIQAISALLQFLLHYTGEPYWDYIDSAMAALGDLYVHVPIEVLIDALNDVKESVRLQAIALLAILKERAPVKLFLELLEHKDAATRKQTIYSLGRHLSRIPIEAIVNKLKDKDKKVGEAAANVLSRSNLEIPSDLLLPLLDCPENIARTAAVRLLGKRMPIERLLTARHDHKWTVRVAAIEILGTLGEQISLDVFLEALCDKNIEVRRVAVQALGKQGERAPISIIMNALQDQRRVNQAAIEILQGSATSLPYEFLQKALHDSDPYIRIMGIKLFQAPWYEGHIPIDKVKNMLQDEDRWVRTAAIQALHQWEAFKPEDPYIITLTDDWCSVNDVALDILTKMGKNAPREPLKTLLGDAKGYMNAIKCLQQTHPKVLGEVVEEASNILLGQGTGELLGSIQQAYIAKVIGNMPNPGPLLVNKLIELLDWPHPKVRMTAAQALDKLKIQIP